MMLKAMIVDDELPSRELLREMLGLHGDIEIVADFGRSQEALDAISTNPPDVLFLDIQMPGVKGFELLERIPAQKRPAVVFVTAHQDYAHRAFDVEAVDYLMKPFDEQRLERALQRVRRRLDSPDAAAPRKEGSEPLARIAVREGERSYFVPVARLLWLESDGKLVRLHAEDGKHEIRESLTRLEEKLDSSRFVRVSRSAIVNVDRIREVQAWFHGDRIIVMENDDAVTTTRSYRDNILRLLEN